MKKIMLTALVALATLNVYSDPIEPSRAQEIAARYTSGKSRPRLVKQTGRRLPARLGSEVSQNAPIYIYSRGENQGFVIVSGDDCLPEVLAVVESGDWDEKQLPPALLNWVDAYSNIIEQAQEQKCPARVSRKATGTRNIGPLCQTHWHQEGPYNDRAPYMESLPGQRAMTGCVATAISQVVFHYRKDCPAYTQYNTPTYGYGDAHPTEVVPKGTPLRWDLMQLKYSGSEPAEMRSAVADLMYVTGTSTWLMYGTKAGDRSTSGELKNVPGTIRGQYLLDCEQYEKWQTSQSGWETAIIKDLEDGHIMYYSGAHPAPKNDGHAVVLDGYRVSDNLFHFNFGWGGNGDGWYTVDDETGMNGFSSGQGMIYKVRPKQPNVKGKIVECGNHGTLYQRVENTIRVNIANNGTFPLKGVNLYISTNKNMTSFTGKATCTDATTVIEPGETKELVFTYKPISSLSYTIYLTTSNQMLMDKVSDIIIQPTEASLSLRCLILNGSEPMSETVTLDGEEQNISVYKIYNDKALLSASVSSSQEGTVAQPSFDCRLYSYNASRGAFEQKTSQINDEALFQPGSTHDVDFTFAGLQKDVLYKAGMKSLILGVDFSQSKATTDSVVYFRVADADLMVTSSNEDEVVMSGHYSADIFQTLATDAAVSRYDLTQVKGNIVHPVSANPNALFYVAEDASIGAGDANVVKGGVCSNLVLQQGYNFQPKADFTAHKAVLSGKSQVGKQSLVVSPFNASTPTGLFARKINKMVDGVVEAFDSVCLEMKVCTPYIILNSDTIWTLSAQDVKVGITAPNAGEPILVPCFKNTTGEEGTYILNDRNFSSAKDKTIDALSAYLQYSRVVSVNPSEISRKITRSATLANTIFTAQETYNESKKDASKNVKEMLRTLLAEARATLTQQPQIGDIEAMNKSLKEGVEAYTNGLTPLTEEGWIDLTGRVKNPSFENTPLNWQRNGSASATAQNTTQSINNYMSGVDGSKVLYITYAASNAGSYAYQDVTDLPQGTYRVVVSVAADRGKHINLIAQSSLDADTLTVEGAEHGPMYFTDAAIDSVQVNDGTLRIAIQTVDGWVKADNVRLYLIDSDDPAVNRISQPSAPMAPVARRGVWTLSGIRVSDDTSLKHLPKGIYIVNGRKVIKR